MKTLQERYPRLYRALVAQGHDPAKAIEILLDAKRGDAHALNWLRVIARMDRPDDPMRDHYERLAFAAEMRGDDQPDRDNQGGATPGASSVLADELDDQDPDVIEAWERSGPRGRP